MSRQTEGKTERGAEPPRTALAVRLERQAMFLRYAAYLVLVGIFFAGELEGELGDLAIITVVVVLHNAFVHATLWTRRYSWFMSPINFVIHLAEISIVVSFTGAEESEFFVLYFFLLIGYTLWRRRFLRIVLVSALCAVAYGIVVAVEWRASGISIAPGIVFIKLASILVCGWLVATLSQLMRKIEDKGMDRARALAASEATIRTILDTAADPILVYDEHEIVTEANDKACEFLGVSRDRIRGKTFRSFLFDDGSVDQKLTEARLRDEYHGEQIFVATEGHELTVDLRIRSFMRNGRRFFVVVTHDITERKALQEATHLANANLARLNRELQQVNELKTGLLTAISQRIRSPLTALLGYLDMLLNDELGTLQPEQRKALLTCRRSTARVFRLIDEAFSVPAAEVTQTRND